MQVDGALVNRSVGGAVVDAAQHASGVGLDDLDRVIMRTPQIDLVDGPIVLGPEPATRPRAQHPPLTQRAGH